MESHHFPRIPSQAGSIAHTFQIHRAQQALELAGEGLGQGSCFAGDSDWQSATENWHLTDRAPSPRHVSKPSFSSLLASSFPSIPITNMLLLVLPGSFAQPLSLFAICLFYEVPCLCFVAAQSMPMCFVMKAPVGCHMVTTWTRHGLSAG